MGIEPVKRGQVASLVCLGVFILLELGSLESLLHAGKGFAAVRSIWLSIPMLVANSVAVAVAAWFGWLQTVVSSEVRLIFRLLVTMDILLFAVIFFYRV